MRWRHGGSGERVFKGLTLVMAVSVLGLMVLIGWELAYGAGPALRKSGWRFLAGAVWDPAKDRFGALPFIFGTLVSSALALVVAVPLSVGTAVYLTELAPHWLRRALTLFIELLAAVPSVILGLWGLFVMVPWLGERLYPWLGRVLGFLPWFRGPAPGASMLAGGLIIAIMIVPIITSVSREILLSVPVSQREAAYALGATRWEVTRVAVLSHAKRGLCGAVILGLGRALGETIAVTMVIGNRPEIAVSLFAPGYTLAGVVANEFNRAPAGGHLAALYEIGLVLLGITLLVNGLGRLLLTALARPGDAEA
jgi:phosphate transport system permease protein